jgi:hypothetical protein
LRGASRNTALALLIAQSYLLLAMQRRPSSKLALMAS